MRHATLAAALCLALGLSLPSAPLGAQESSAEEDVKLARGLVERRRDSSDRRVVTVNLTRAGEQLIRSALPGTVAVIVESLAVLNSREQQQLAALCRKLGRQEA